MTSRNPLDQQRAERLRLREITEVQSRAIETLRQRNVVLRERIKELEDKLNEACDYIPQWFIDKHELRP